MLFTLLLLLLAMVFNVAAQLTLKSAVNSISIDIFSITSILRLVCSMRLWLGALLYGGSFVFYVIALSRGELGRIGPISQALTVLGLFIASSIIFKEPINITKVFGLAFLVFGIVTISIR